MEYNIWAMVLPVANRGSIEKMFRRTVLVPGIPVVVWNRMSQFLPVLEYCTPTIEPASVKNIENCSRVLVLQYAIHSGT